MTPARCRHGRTDEHCTVCDATSGPHYLEYLRATGRRAAADRLEARMDRW